MKGVRFEINDDLNVTCDICAWGGMSQELHPISDIQIRLDPGSTVPAGQCPNCGMLAYLTPLKKPVCKSCGSDNVTCDALMTWDVEAQAWEEESILDHGDCGPCSGPAKFVWVPA